MEKSAMIIAAFLTAASCTGSFVANGTVEGDRAGAEGAYVALLDGDGEIAAADIVDGKFTLKAKADPTKICAIALKTGGEEDLDPSAGYMVSVIPSKGTVEIVLAEDASTATGNPVTDALNEYQSKLYDAFFSAQDAIMKTLESEGGDSESEALAISANRDKAIVDMSVKAYEENRDNALGLQALYMILDTDSGLSTEEVKALVAKGGDFIREDEGIKIMLRRKEDAEATGTGAKFKEISGKTAEGGVIKLSDFVNKGRYVLVDFWASWCGPCMNAVPKVRALLEKYEDQGLDLVGINCWERKPENGPAKAREMNMTWPVIYAEDEAVDAYGVEAIPTLILFSPDGTILERIVGDSGVEEALRKYFE